MRVPRVSTSSTEPLRPAADPTPGTLPIHPIPERGHVIDPEAQRLHTARLRGKRGRLEVWYTTFTDPRTGTGFWIHHEVVTPTDGGPPRALGWISVFPCDGPPVTERFGPHAPGSGAGEGAPGEGAPYFSTPGVRAAADRLTGTAGRIRWHLDIASQAAPLYTFPRWVWRTRLLPAAQVVPAPTALFDGTVEAGGRRWELTAAPGAVARIAGHGNARSWGWLHADLGGGDVLEVVAAVARQPVMRLLPPLPLVKLRVAGRDWPGDPLLAAPLFTARLGLPEWTVDGRWGRRRLRVEVHQEAEDCVSLEYTDPDGSAVTCVNTERAGAEIVVERRSGGRFAVERRWTLDHTAHAEIGTRP